MSDEEFYGAAFPALREAERILFELASHYQAAESPSARMKPIAKCLSRIKTAESMTNKLLRKNLEANAFSHSLTCQWRMEAVKDIVRLSILQARCCAFGLRLASKSL